MWEQVGSLNAVWGAVLYLSGVCAVPVFSRRGGIVHEPEPEV